jgi:hypothetical protein
MILKIRSWPCRSLSVTEFKDVFVVGIPNSPDEIAVNCEMYGHIASSEEDLIVHKRSRGLIFIL